MNNRYSILVNTCDNFEDCWNPFFQLMKVFWPDCKASIFLNTEIKDYKSEYFSVTAVKVARNIHNDKLKWGECLIRALSEVEDEIILYLQEDYFFKAPVKNELIEKYVSLIKNDESIDCIHLTDQAVISEGISKYKNLLKVKNRQTYRISCQAAIWRKTALLACLRPNESGWDFEKYGSKRSSLLKQNYLVVDPKFVQLGKFEIIPYIFTGIVQGRWNEDVISLFKKYDIKIDYSIRGFIKDTPKKKFMIRLLIRINKLPLLLNSYLYLFKIIILRKN